MQRPNGRQSEAPNVAGLVTVTGGWPGDGGLWRMGEDNLMGRAGFLGFAKNMEETPSRFYPVWENADGSADIRETPLRGGLPDGARAIFEFFPSDGELNQVEEVPRPVMTKAGRILEAQLRNGSKLKGAFMMAWLANPKSFVGKGLDWYVVTMRRGDEEIAVLPPEGMVHPRDAWEEVGLATGTGAKVAGSGGGVGNGSGEA